MEALKEAFKNHDTDESGTVDLEELSSLLKDVGLNVTDKQLLDILEGADGDGSGALSIDEFTTLMGDLQQGKIQGINAKDIQAPVNRKYGYKSGKQTPMRNSFNDYPSQDRLNQSTTPKPTTIPKDKGLKASALNLFKSFSKTPKK